MPPSFTHKSFPALSFRLYMPLAHERALRDSVDGLFYADAVGRRLDRASESDLAKHFPRRARETRAAYRRRIIARLGGYFSGYSLQHVEGRFRKGGIRTLRQQGRAPTLYGPKYLIDETSAVIHFVVPVAVKRAIPAEADRIRWAFIEILMGSLLERIKDEAEIWLLETGFGDRIHVWDRRRGR
jgi:hypothetical protein